MTGVGKGKGIANGWRRVISHFGNLREIELVGYFGNLIEIEFVRFAVWFKLSIPNPSCFLLEKQVAKILETLFLTRHDLKSNHMLIF